MDVVEELVEHGFLNVAKDVDKVLGYLPAIREPDEIEDDDGYITLAWYSKIQDQSFSLVFPNNGEVIGCYSSVNADPIIPPWKCSVNDGLQIIVATSHLAIQELISS